MMGFFDQVSELLQGGDFDKYQAILDWVNAQGGVESVLNKFHEQGMGETISSWLSPSAGNNPITAEDILSVLGSPAIAQLGEKLGIDVHQASDLLAKLLPQIIDALSPTGEIQANSGNDLIAQGLAMIKKQFFS